MALYYAKIKSSKSKSAHIFWIGWLINEKSGCPCLRNSVLIYESLRYQGRRAQIGQHKSATTRAHSTYCSVLSPLPTVCQTAQECGSGRYFLNIMELHHIHQTLWVFLQMSLRQQIAWMAHLGWQLNQRPANSISSQHNHHHHHTHNHQSQEFSTVKSIKFSRPPRLRRRCRDSTRSSSSVWTSSGGSKAPPLECHRLQHTGVT